jgi:uncharacterized iron-regulated membrane protein
MPHDGMATSRQSIVRARPRVPAGALAWFEVTHRWLGFTCGVILIIAGLTGSLLAFYIEIERNLYPHMQTAPQAMPSSYEAVYARLSELPVERPGYWKIEIPPAGVGGPITSRYNDSDRTRMVTLDPDTLEVTRDARWSETFFTWIYDVHQHLLMGPPGKVLMSVAAVLMVMMLFTGLGNWLLKDGGGLVAKLGFKRQASAAQRTYDIHKLVGLVALLLLPALVTAPLISLPKQVHPLLERIAPLTEEPAVQSTRLPGVSRLTIDSAIAIGESHFPGSRVVWVRVPATAGEPYDLQIRQAGAPMSRFPRTHLWIDQYSGRVLAMKDPRTDSFSDTVLNWLVPIHDGKAFGLFGRVVVAVLGLLPVALFVTGVMRWWQKRVVRLKVQRRAAPAGGIGQLSKYEEWS